MRNIQLWNRKKDKKILKVFIISLLILVALTLLLIFILINDFYKNPCSYYKFEKKLCIPNSPCLQYSTNCPQGCKVITGSPCHPRCVDQNETLDCMNK